MTASRPRLGLARRLVGWVAVYAFVLHAVFAGAVGVRIAANAAAGFELCLDHPDDGPLPAHGQHAHDQCALHCAAAVGFAALAVALIAVLFPLGAARYSPRRIVRSASIFHSRAGQSRAPPLTA